MGTHTDGRSSPNSSMPSAREPDIRPLAERYAEVQERIRAAGLPEKHAVRIGEGW